MTHARHWLIAFIIFLVAGALLAVFPANTDDETETDAQPHETASSADLQVHSIRAHGHTYTVGLPTGWTHEIRGEDSLVVVFEPRSAGSAPATTGSHEVVADITLRAYQKLVSQSLRAFYATRGSQDWFEYPNSLSATPLDLPNGGAVFFLGVSGMYGGNATAIDLGPLVIEVIDIHARQLPQNEILLAFLKSIRLETE